MNEHTTFERFVADRFADLDLVEPPEHSIDPILTRAHQVRPLPRWLATIKEPPMRLNARVAVGSPIVRVTSLAVLVMLLSLLTAGGLAIGATLLASPVPSGPRTIVVAQDGTGDHTTISEAVAAARDGDTVSILPGTYRETVLITADVKVVGDGPAGSVVIAFAAEGATVGSAEDGVPIPFGIALEDSDARLSNLSVTGPVDGVGIFVTGGAPVLESVAVVLTGEPTRPPHAFRFTGETTATLQDATGNWFLDVAGGSSPTIERLTLDGGGFIGDTGTRPVIRDSRIGFALDIGSGAEPIIEDNDLLGLKVIGGAPVIRDNTFANPGFVAGSTGDRASEEVTAIEITGGSPLIVGNRIGDHEYGITVGFGATPTIEGNQIESNTTGILVAGAATTPTITGNTFCHNGQDLVVPAGSPVTLDGNTVCEAGTSGAP